MMRLILYFLILVGSVWLGLKIAQSPGYILVSYETWAMETTLWFGTIAAIVSFFVLYFVVRFLARVLSVGSSLSAWSRKRREKKIRQKTNEGLALLAEGKYQKAEKLLTKFADKSETPMINYLAAAQAAQERDDTDKRDGYLQLAQQSGNHSEVAVGLTQAELQMKNMQLERAVATLEHLNQISPKHPAVLKMLTDVYCQLEDWDALLKLLPRIKKQKLLYQDEFEIIERVANEEHFKIMSSKLNPDELAKAWKKLPKRMHYDAVIVVEYSNALMRHEEQQHAEKIIRHALDHEWDERLVRQYAKVQLPKSSKQLKHAESWLKKHGESPDLLVCLGQLSLRNQLWGKARSFFESALNLQPSVHALHDLGHVYEQLDDKQLALDCYKKALDLVVDHS